MPNGLFKGSSGDKREMRESVDTGTGVHRTNSNVPERKGRGAFVNYYKDLGISATQWQADAIREEESGYRDNIAENKKFSADQAAADALNQKAVTASQTNINAINKALDYSNWAKTNETTVNLEKPMWQEGKMKYKDGNWVMEWQPGYHSSAGGIENPRKVMINVGKYTIAKGAQSGIPRTTAPTINRDGSWTFSTHAGGDISRDLINALTTAQNNRRKWYDSDPDIVKRREELSSEQRVLSDKQGLLDASAGQLKHFNDQISLSEELRQKLWDRTHKDYKDKMDNLRDVFSNKGSK